MKLYLINLNPMLKNLGEAITWIESQVRFKPKADLNRMKSAYLSLDLDLSKVKKIHVAGTNGKGSVCAYLSNTLIEAGYKVGTFTSPYLVSFHERIRYQFKDIKDDELLDLIRTIASFNQSFEKDYGESLSFFELLTLMSLIYFDQKKVDVIVIEVGIGGLLDATNILNYDLSLITSIGFDHMKQLGNTLESIAYNKLGILKPGNHLITTVDQALYPYFKDHIKKASITAEYYSVKDLKKMNDIPLIFQLDDMVYQLPLIGEYQLLNALISIKAIHYLFPYILDEEIARGLENTVWPGRLDEIDYHIYIDGGHNTHAIEALKQSALSTFKDKKIWVLFSALSDKDISGMLDIIESFTQRIFITTFPDPRFKELTEFLRENIEYKENSLDALCELKGMMDDDTILIVTGSLHFVGYIKNHYQK